MPVLTRNHKKKLKKHNQKQKSTMVEENPFYIPHNQDDDDEEITKETVKEAQQDPKFGKLCLGNEQREVFPYVILPR